ncbi:MAG: hypothetical protein IPH09_05480 [bacterium]|nr:hypothetical protein [bacterium]
MSDDAKDLRDEPLFKGLDGDHPAAAAAEAPLHGADLFAFGDEAATPVEAPGSAPARPRKRPPPPPPPPRPPPAASPKRRSAGAACAGT